MPRSKGDNKSIFEALMKEMKAAQRIERLARGMEDFPPEESRSPSRSPSRGRSRSRSVSRGPSLRSSAPAAAVPTSSSRRYNVAGPTLPSLPSRSKSSKPTSSPSTSLKSPPKAVSFAPVLASSEPRFVASDAPSFNEQVRLEPRIRGVDRVSLHTPQEISQHEDFSPVTGYTAPRNPTQLEAEELLKKSIEDKFARNSSQKVQDILTLSETYNPALYLNKMMEAIPPEKYHETLNKHQPFIDDYMKDLKQRMRVDLLEDVVPEINSEFASKGMFFSPRREKAIQKAIHQREMALNQTMKEMEMGERHRLMEHYHQNRRHHLGLGQLVSQTATNAQHGLHEHANALHQHDLQQAEADRMQASVLGQLGHEQQQQYQNVLNEMEEKKRAEYELPMIHTLQRAALNEGMPHAVPRNLPTARPNPPNPFMAGAGLMTQLAGLGIQNAQQQPQQRYFAEGGTIGGRVPLTHSFGELKKLHSMSDSQGLPYEQEMMSMGNHLLGQQIDPMSQYLFTLGSHQLAGVGNRTDPMTAYGEGSLHALDAHNAAFKHNISQKQQYLNLLDKMQASKIAQRKIFEDYHTYKEGQEQTERFHKDTLGEHKLDREERKLERALDREERRLSRLETKDYHDAHLALEEKKLSSKSKMPKEEVEDLKALRKQALSAHKARKEALYLLGTVKNTNTNKFYNDVGEIRFIGPSLRTTLGGPREKDVNKITEGGQSLAEAAFGALPAKEQTVARWNSLENKKPNSIVTSDSNVERTEKVLRETEEPIKKYKFVKDFMKKGLGNFYDAEGAFEEEFGGSELTQSAKENNVLLEDSSHEEMETIDPVSGKVFVKDPNGNPGKIPKEYLSEALKAGFTLDRPK